MTWVQALKYSNFTSWLTTIQLLVSGLLRKYCNQSQFGFLLVLGKYDNQSLIHLLMVAGPEAPRQPAHRRAE